MTDITMLEILRFEAHVCPVVFGCSFKNGLRDEDYDFEEII